MAALGEAGLLGLVLPAEVGGGGQVPRQAADVVARLSEVSGSAAMVLDHRGRLDVRRSIAAGRYLTTLAFSESGSRLARL